MHVMVIQNIGKDDGAMINTISNIWKHGFHLPVYKKCTQKPELAPLPLSSLSSFKFWDDKFKNYTYDYSKSNYWTPKQPTVVHVLQEIQIHDWLVVKAPTPPSEKNYARQIGSSSQAGVKMKHIWNHHPNYIQVNLTVAQMIERKVVLDTSLVSRYLLGEGFLHLEGEISSSIIRVGSIGFSFVDMHQITMWATKKNVLLSITQVV